MIPVNEDPAGTAPPAAEKTVQPPRDFPELYDTSYVSPDPYIPDPYFPNPYRTLP